MTKLQEKMKAPEKHAPRDGDGVLVYENIFIGNFLYGLGMALGSRLKGQALASSLNLLQQTPLDTMLGDLLADFGGTVLLYEFKRRSGDHNKEAIKAEKLRVVLQRRPNLNEISRTTHWYVVLEEAAVNAEISIHVSPYMEIGMGSTSEPIPFSRYVDRVAAHILDDGIARPPCADIQEYLHLVAALNNVDTANAGGFVLAVKPDGSIQYTLLADIRELALSHRRHLELARQRQLEREAGRDPGAGVEQAAPGPGHPEHERDYGMER
jgi:hypothetical protein